MAWVAVRADTRPLRPPPALAVLISLHACDPQCHRLARPRSQCCCPTPIVPSARPLVPPSASQPPNKQCELRPPTTVLFHALLPCAFAPQLATKQRELSAAASELGRMRAEALSRDVGMADELRGRATAELREVEEELTRRVGPLGCSPLGVAMLWVQVGKAVLEGGWSTRAGQQGVVGPVCPCLWSQPTSG